MKNTKLINDTIVEASTLESKDRAMGQSLNGAFSLGLGGAVGNIIGSVIVDNFGVPAMILFAAGISLLGFFFMLLAKKRG